MGAGSLSYGPMIILLSSCYGHRRHLHSFPTRRSSDLSWARSHPPNFVPIRSSTVLARDRSAGGKRATIPRLMSDRKSTRLNSSHANISYAVFCLKKKKVQQNTALAAHVGYDAQRTPPD